jgi:large subunit ribosomal protein L2
VSDIKYGFKKGEVVDIIHDPARNSPLAKIRSGDKEFYIIAAEGLKVGDTLDVEGEAKPGNVLQPSRIPKGSSVFAIENYPGSGPKLCCAPGAKALIIASESGKVTVQMPSKKLKMFNHDCLASIGIPAGGGRRDKPFVNAGQKSYLMETRNRYWPRVSAVKMNPVDHPFGGHTKPGTPKTISRHAPPGAKVGSVAARRSGLKKK